MQQMTRTKNNNALDKVFKAFSSADAILTADWHLMEKDNAPVCRMDDFWETQWKKVDFVSSLQKTYKCPVIHSGDLFDYWKPSPMLLSETITHLPAKFYTVYGNHDLPQHSIDLKHKSGIHTLATAGVLEVLDTCHWLETPTKPSIQISNRKILVWHVMNYQGKEPWPGCIDYKSRTLLRKYPEYDLILTGDNHKTFIEEHDDRLLVNPGSLFRLTAAQKEHNPKVFLWYAKLNKVIPIDIPIDEEVISQEHLELVKEKDKRIDAFISTLNGDWAAEMSFEQNLEIFRQANKIDPAVMEIIYKSIEV
jgi:predicted phosphodiesterase